MKLQIDSTNSDRACWARHTNDVATLIEVCAVGVGSAIDIEGKDSISGTEEIDSLGVNYRIYPYVRHQQLASEDLTPSVTQPNRIIVEEILQW